MNLVITVPTKDMNDIWFVEVIHLVLFHLKQQGLEDPFYGIKLVFTIKDPAEFDAQIRAICVQRKLNYNSIDCARFVTLSGVIENMRQRQVFDAIVSILQSRDLERVVIVV
jgi:hypothetical protein